MISEATFQSFSILIQLMIIRNGFGCGVLSCIGHPSGHGAQDSASSWVNPTTSSLEKSGASATGPDPAISCSF